MVYRRFDTAAVSQLCWLKDGQAGVGSRRRLWSSVVFGTTDARPTGSCITPDWN